MAALAAALVAWAALGSDDHPVVVRAVASAALAGAVVGLALAGPLVRRPAGRALVLIGAAGGVAMHPIAWTVFVLWTWTAAWVEGRVPAGSLLEGLFDVLVWSVPSASYGAVVTIPAMIGAAWATRRALAR